MTMEKLFSLTLLAFVTLQSIDHLIHAAPTTDDPYSSYSNDTRVVKFEPEKLNDEICREKNCINSCWEHYYRTTGYCYHEQLCVCYNQDYD